MAMKIPPINTRDRRGARITREQANDWTDEQRLEAFRLLLDGISGAYGRTLDFVMHDVRCEVEGMAR